MATGPALRSRDRRVVTLAAAAAAAVALVALLGYLAGTSRAGVTEQVGTAHTAEMAISIQTEDWTYGVPLDVAWTDRNGAWHSGGRPECLPPSDAAVPGVRFAAVPVEVRGAGFRAVVAVFCD